MGRIQRFSAVLLAALLWALLGLALPAAADAGDYDRIDDYTVTVELRSDGSADITYEIDWQVIGGGEDDYLSWVRVGLANRYAEEPVNLTPDTVNSIDLVEDGGSYAQVNFVDRYYAPDYAAANGCGSAVHFAFRVHQSHLFTLEEDGTASYVFTPGWFDDLNVQRMTVRWRADDGVLADNTDSGYGYLTWVFGPLTHGQAGTVRVTVPVTQADGFDPALAQGDEPMYTGSLAAGPRLLFTELFIFVVLFASITVIIVCLAGRPPRWGGGFGVLDADDWIWYTNGVHTIRRARTAPPPAGYHATAPPASFRAGGGSFRGGGAGRRSGGGGHSSCASSCACACASSCACACACAGGGRAGCSAKNFYRVSLPADPDRPGPTPDQGGTAL